MTANTVTVVRSVQEGLGMYGVEGRGQMVLIVTASPTIVVRMRRAKKEGEKDVKKEETSTMMVLQQQGRPILVKQKMMPTVTIVTPVKLVKVELNTK